MNKFLIAFVLMVAVAGTVNASKQSVADLLSWLDHEYPEDQELQQALDVATDLKLHPDQSVLPPWVPKDFRELGAIKPYVVKEMKTAIDDGTKQPFPAMKPLEFKFEHLLKLENELMETDDSAPVVKKIKAQVKDMNNWEDRYEPEQVVHDMGYFTDSDWMKENNPGLQPALDFDVTIDDSKLDENYGETEKVPNSAPHMDGPNSAVASSADSSSVKCAANVCATSGTNGYAITHIQPWIKMVKIFAKNQKIALPSNVDNKFKVADQLYGKLKTIMEAIADATTDAARNAAEAKEACLKQCIKTWEEKNINAEIVNAVNTLAEFSG